MTVLTERRLSNVEEGRSTTLVFNRSSEVQAIPVPVVIVHWVLDEPFHLVVSIGRVVEPIINWFEAVLVAYAPIAIELEKPPVLVL